MAEEGHRQRQPLGSPSRPCSSCRMHGCVTFYSSGLPNTIEGLVSHLNRNRSNILGSII